MLKKIFLGTIIFFMGIAGLVLAEENPVSSEVQVSLEVAQNWLNTVDKGQYDQTWKETSEYFKSLVAESQWTTQIQAGRQPLGNLVSRKLKDQQHKTSLQGAADGEYYILIFDTSFTNKKEAVETITVMKDKDGQWRVAGYFIK